MRPLQLRITGLRSYRTETKIDFSDLNLLAIVGATGSGKSSLLEAITYALYGTATWGGRNVKSLISDGALRMSVSLSFEADGQRWLITRTTPSGTYPPASQELTCLTDPACAKVDGSAELRARITELIGLDYDGFKSCVLLPQGRFDQLLKSTAAERVGILKGIVGLGALDDIAVRANRLERVVQDRYDEIIDARRGFLPDPREIHDQAEARIAALCPRAQALKGLEERAGSIAEEVRVHRERARAGSEAATRLSGLVDPDLLARLRSLAQLESSLEAQRGEAAMAAEAARREAADALAAVAKARESGRSAVTIAGLRGALSAASGELEAIARERATLERKRAQLDGGRQELEAARAEAEVLVRTLEEQSRALERTEGIAREARVTAEMLAARIEAIATARLQLQAAETACGSAEADAEQARERAAAVTAELERTETALARAEAQLEGAQRADAAARAAQGCRPGEPCPVCARILPDTFHAPSPALDLVTFGDALDAAKRSARSGAEERAQARADEAAALGRVASATATRDSARAAWAELATTPLPGDLHPTCVDLDPATLAQIGDPAEQAELELAALRAEQTATSETHRNLAARIAASEAELLRRDQELAEDAGEVDRRECEIRTGLERQPDWVGVTRQADPDALGASQEQLLAALEEAEAREQHAAEANAEVSVRQGELGALADRMRGEVEAPAISERSSLQGLAVEAARLGEEPLPPAPALPAGIPALIAWGEQILGATSERLDGLGAAAAAEREEAEAKDSERMAMLADAGFETPADLREAVADATGALMHATAERRHAGAQLAPAARLDELADRAKRLRGGLRELAFQLGDGKFVGFVVEQRQRALLALASGILGQVTSGQYGFTEDFRIVDRRTGTARTPDTLSGGETFLASLALALGLVELAGRSGGRLQALFLDEGFGSLDPEALDHALDELERRAESGRLVAIISHVPTIAERIEQVLRVSKTAQGSEAVLLSEDERVQLLLDEAAGQVPLALPV